MLKPQFRLDIQALRAVAVLAVVGFHLWPETITGGFVGVDVFFVISGYLITAHLIRDAQKTDRISFAKFYTRRAIRLLPSALAVLLTTAIGIILFVPRMNWESWLPQLFSSAFYVENWHLLFNSVDYLLAAEAPSPTQHYWTLSVEEQFYIFLPMVLFIALMLARKTKLSLNRSIFLFLIPLFAASFVLNLILTVESPSVAYFNTFSRAWEFGIGALLANLLWRPQKFKVALEILGFAMILLSVFVIRPDQAFPGWLAVLPVAGAALIILAENQRSGPIHKALAPLGDISYAVYLWHWPLIVLLPFILQTPLDINAKILLLIASFALGWLSTRYLEEPIRFNDKIAFLRQPKNVIRWAAASMVFISAIGLVTPQISKAVTQEAVAETEKLALQLEDCIGAMSKISLPADCQFAELQTQIFPDPNVLNKDDGNRAECWASQNDSTVHVCALGQTSGYKKRIFAVGDSHLNSLIPAFDALGKANHWRIDLAGRKSCHWSTGNIILSDKQDQKSCREWNKSVTQTIRSINNLDGILVSHWQESLVGKGKGSEKSLVKGLVGAWKQRPSAEIPIFAIKDVPKSSQELLDCAARKLLKASTKCSLKQSSVDRDAATKKAVSQTPNSFLIDLSKYFCESGKCFAVVGNTFVYRDKNGHVTGTFAKSLAKAISLEIEKVIPVG